LPLALLRLPAKLVTWFQFDCDLDLPNHLTDGADDDKMAFKDIPRLHRNNMQTLRRSPLAELSGALGDLGTFLPIMIVLAKQHSISLSSTLVTSGIFNIATGVFFGIPLPVQPMKAISAASIGYYNGWHVVQAAGSIVGLLVLLLAASGLLRRLARLIPVPVVKGIQLGAAFQLIIAAGASLIPWSLIYPPHDNLLWAFAVLFVLIVTQRAARFPFALVMTAVGLIVALVVALVHGQRLPYPSIWRPYLIVPTWGYPPVWGMAAAQLPLTLLNSVVAVDALARDLLPDLPAPGVTAIGVSVGLMNLSACWVGGMPVCHGSGGLAAQYRFGARSGASVIVLGAVKLLLGLLFGDTLLRLLELFPRSIMGVMVIAAGLQLAMVAESLNHGASDLWETSVAGDHGDDDTAGPSGSVLRQLRTHRDLSEQERRERWTVMLMTTAGIVAFRNDAIGFVAGLLCHGSYKFADWYEKRQAARGAGPGETPSLLD
jgi:xanthine/uracil permease